MKNTLIPLAGAAVGGLVGHFAFGWLLEQNFYGLVLPGGLLGMGAGCAKNRSIWLAVGCSIAAVLLGFFSEWRFRPFAANESLNYFVTHIHKLQSWTLLMIGVGGAIAFWVPYRSIQHR